MKFTNFHKCNTEFKYRTFYYTVRVCRGLRFHTWDFSSKISTFNFEFAKCELRSQFFFRNEPFLKGQCHEIVDPLSICWRIFWIWFQFCGDTCLCKKTLYSLIDTVEFSVQDGMLWIRMRKKIRENKTKKERFPWTAVYPESVKSASDWKSKCTLRGLEEGLKHYSFYLQG